MHYQDFPSSHISIIIAVEDGGSYWSSHRLWYIFWRTSGAGCLVPVFSCFMIMLGHTWVDGQHISCRSSAGRCLIIHPRPNLMSSNFHLFLHLKKFLSGQSQHFQNDRQRWVSHSGYNPRQQTSTTQEYKSWSHGLKNVSVPEVNMLKNNSILVVSVPINLLIKLGSVSVNGFRETYFVDALHKF